MRFKVNYEHKVVKRDLPDLPKIQRDLVFVAIEEKLSIKPEVFGKPLRNSLKGYRSLRVGDYRIIFRIQSYVVKIFIIGHRSNVYAEVLKRMSK